MVKIAAYAAECVRDDWLQTERLGQQPLVRYRESHEGPLVRAQDFTPAAANQVARVTRDTLKAIAFPTFVADLIKGTFEAITNSSIQQMEAYMRLWRTSARPSTSSWATTSRTTRPATGWPSATRTTCA